MLKNRLKDYREAFDLTGKEMADLLGVTHDTLRNWETGRGYPHFTFIRHLVLVTDVEADWWLEIPD